MDVTVHAGILSNMLRGRVTGRPAGANGLPTDEPSRRPGPALPGLDAQNDPTIELSDVSVKRPACAVSY